MPDILVMTGNVIDNCRAAAMEHLERRPE
ncbi:MAG: hypothetical protein ACD_75C00341G0001, partial [uncultured bacterium]